MNRFINLKISKSYNYLILNDKSKDNNITKENSFENNQEGKFPYKIILNNLITFLYKKLTPFLFQEVKDYLKLQYIKYKSRNCKINNSSNKSYNDALINSDNININNNINLSSRHPLNDVKFKIEFTNKRTKTNYHFDKKLYMPKSEQKKAHSGKNKYKNIKKNNYKMNKNTTFNKSKSKSKETKKRNNLSQKHFFIDDNGGNEAASIKTLLNKQIRRNKPNSKTKNIFQYKTKKENSRDSNNSISDSRSIFFNSNRKNNDEKKNKTIISNILYTTRQYNDNKNIINNSSNIKKHLTKGQPSVNERLLYHLSFNNNYNKNINSENCNNDFQYIKNNGNACSLKKNAIKKSNLQIYKGSIEQKIINKSKVSNKTAIIQKSLKNLIKSKQNSNKSNSYSTLKNKNIINSQRNKKTINGIEYNNDLYNLNTNEKSIYIGKNNNKIDENKNLANKKYKLLNEEMMKKIKNTIDDNLKIMFNFSYENFLSKESEQESKELSIERQRYIEERNYSGERI